MSEANGRGVMWGEAEDYDLSPDIVLFEIPSQWLEDTKIVCQGIKGVSISFVDWLKTLYVSQAYGLWFLKET